MAQRRSQLSSRTGRIALPASDAPEWEVISPGVRLGYRRGRGSQGRGGTWLAASRGPDGQRIQARLGKADDVTAADGEAILSTDQARDRARAWAKTVRAGNKVASPTLTVGDVLTRYLEARDADGMKSIYDARSRDRTHIRPKLGSLTLAELKAERITRWRNEMATAPRRVRTGMAAQKVSTRPHDVSDSEAVRRRRDTANRTLTLLKAALNWAHQHRLTDDDSAWRHVKPFRNTTAARVRFLSLTEQQQLLDTTTDGLHDLVAAALMTGARFGELARLQVRDFDEANATVFIAESKSGKARHIPLTAGGLALFTRLAADQTATAPLLRQDGGQPWKPATYQRAFKAAVEAAGLPGITLHELRHSYASTMVRAGAPMLVVAQALGHSDARMAERHYAHLAPSYVAETIRRTAPDLRVSL